MSMHGRNVWYDLMTTDTEGAIRFYGKVLGWKAQPWAEAPPDRPYTMWMAGDRPIGGVIPLPAEVAKGGFPPHWMGYTVVEDADTAAEKARSLGGKVYQAPWDIPSVGRVAVLGDPQGAVFAVIKPQGEMPPVQPGRLGEVSWAELNTTDYESAWKFYSGLFGWQHRDSMDMGGGEIYFMFNTADGVTKGGMSNVATKMKAPAHWLYYVTVRDVNETIARIKEAGGQVLNGPMEVPGNDIIAQCQDPQGAFFAIYSEGKRG
jgi:hypothetical protein